MSNVPIQIEIRFQGREKLLLVDDLDFIIGRSSKLKVAVDSNNISREHVRIQSLNGKLWITDLSSTNGTFLGGKRIQAQVSTEYRGEEFCIGPLGEGVYIKLTYAKEATRSLISEALARAQINGTNVGISSPGVRPAPAAYTPPTPAPAPEPAPAYSPAPTSYAAPTSTRPAPASTYTGGTSTGIRVDSGFLVNQLANASAAPAPAPAPAGFGMGGGGTPQFDGINIELEARKKALVELEKRRLVAEREIAEVKKVREQAELTIRLADEKRRDLQKLEQQIHYYELQIQELHTKVQNVEAHSQHRILTVETQTEQRLSALEHESQQRLVAMQSEEKRQQDIIAHMNHQVAQAQQHRDQAEAHFRAEDQRIVDLHEQLKLREAEMSRRRYEIQAEIEKMQTESEFVKKRILLETDTLHAEAQLRRAQVEKEIEELRTRRQATEREVDAMLAKAEAVRSHVEGLAQEQQRLENENRNNHIALTEIRAAVTNAENHRRNLETETQTLADKITAANEESQRVLNYGRTNADETMRRATDEAKQLIEEGLRNVADSKAKYDEEIRVYRDETERQLQAQQQKMLADLADDRREADELIAHARGEWEREHADLKSRATREYEAAKTGFMVEVETARRGWLADNEAARAKELRARAVWEEEMAAEKEKFHAAHANDLKNWHSEMESIKQKDMASLSQWRMEQDTKVQEKLSGDIGGLIHAVASTALTKLQIQPDQTIRQSDLMNALEPAMKEALLSEASTHGPFNPNRESQAKTFWVQFGKKAALGVAALAALISAPRLMTTYFETVKANQMVANGASDAFSRQLKEARARLLELNLEVRPDFQASYFENILYNDAYLEIKQDPNVQKEWVIKLYQFFFEVLQVPDRIVVDFIPLESSTIRGIADLRKTMNSKTFETNLEQMKQLEKKKLEQEIYPLLSNNTGSGQGKKNWDRLRKLEAEFYQEKLRNLASRHLATDGSAAPAADVSPSPVE